jgi:GH25 family lysozyme M1 (1,4-beta-N-acetylmuramidase)
MMRPFHASIVLAVASFAGCNGGEPTPRHRPDVGSTEEGLKVCAGASLVEGIDVSHYEPNVDWAKVKAAGREFAFMKATEGTTYVDPSFTMHWANSKAAGVLRGAYHFHRVDSDPIAQADHFLATVGKLEPGDMIMLDVEDANHGGTASSITANVKACIEHIASKAGQVPVLYTGMWYWTGHMGTPTGFSKYPMFIAAYPSAYSSFTNKTYCPTIPDDFKTWAFWQYSDGDPTVTAGIPTMPGVGQSCDRDVFNGTLAELKAFAGVTGAGGTGGGAGAGGSAAAGKGGSAAAGKGGASTAGAGGSAAAGKAGASTAGSGGTTTGTGGASGATGGASGVSGSSGQSTGGVSAGGTTSSAGGGVGAAGASNGAAAGQGGDSSTGGASLAPVADAPSSGESGGCAIDPRAPRDSLWGFALGLSALVAARRRRAS